MKYQIRPANLSDAQEMYDVFQEVISQGETFDYSPDTSFEDFRNEWLENSKAYDYVAVANEEPFVGKVIGMYKILPNRRGLADHVANGSYMIHKDFRGLGLGRALGEHSYQEAKAKGFTAMQYNFVVSTNVAGVSLWKSLGMNVIGTIPKAYRHKKLGLVDALIMHKFL
jgi:L-amino acid N-acyltransferase YncA